MPRKQIPLFELPPNAKSRPKVRRPKQDYLGYAPGQCRAGAGAHFSPSIIHETFPPLTQWFTAPVDFPTRVILLGDVLADLNPNHRPGSRHGYQVGAGVYAAWSRKQREWKAKAYAAWCDYGHPVYAEKIRVTLTVARNKVVDPDNALAAYKKVIDGMVDKTRPVTERLVPDDGRTWLEFAPVLFSTGYCHRYDPYTIIDFLPMRLHIENEIARYKRHEEIRHAIASWEENQWEEWEP